MTTVSIAMATYNGERFLREQLDSFVAQTRLPDELVISDDCSTDSTLAIADAFAEHAPFAVRIERNPENLGYSQNFGRALARCTGDTIFLSDQDDVWDPDKIATVLAAMDSAGRPVITVNDQRIADADGRETGETIFGKARRVGYSDAHLIAGACTALPRHLLELILPVPAGIPYDAWIGMAADSLNIKVLIERPLQIFRRHGENASQPVAVGANPSRLSEFKIHGFTDPRPGWADETGWRTELIERLTSDRTELRDAVGREAFQAGVDSNRRRVDAIRRRSDIIARPRWRRAPHIFSGWTTGVYREFDGLASALKDILRA